MDISEDDQKIDPNADARYGRKLVPGTHECTVIDVTEGTTNAGKPKTTLVLVTDPGPDLAPEGAVKIDYICTVGTFSLRNLIETFEPSKLGKKCSLDTNSYKGAKVKATTKWEDEKARPDGSGTYKARASIVKLIPGTVAKPAAVDAPF